MQPWPGASVTVARLDEDSEDVALRMLELGVRDLPVMDGEEVIGVISARDLLMLQAGT